MYAGHIKKLEYWKPQLSYVFVLCCSDDDLPIYNREVLESEFKKKESNLPLEADLAIPILSLQVYSLDLYDFIYFKVKLSYIIQALNSYNLDDVLKDFSLTALDVQANFNNGTGFILIVQYETFHC